MAKEKNRDLMHKTIFFYLQKKRKREGKQNQKNSLKNVFVKMTKADIFTA